MHFRDLVPIICVLGCIVASPITPQETSPQSAEALALTSFWSFIARGGPSTNEESQAYMALLKLIPESEKVLAARTMFANQKIVSMKGMPEDSDTDTDGCDSEWTMKLYDSYGDGWNGAYMTISDCYNNPLMTRITLPEGGYSEICLSALKSMSTFSVSVSTGEYPDEVFWEMYQNGESMHSGGANVSQSYGCSVTASPTPTPTGGPSCYVNRDYSQSYRDCASLDVYCQDPELDRHVFTTVYDAIQSVAAGAILTFSSEFLNCDYGSQVSFGLIVNGVPQPGPSVSYECDCYATPKSFSYTATEEITSLQIVLTGGLYISWMHVSIDIPDESHREACILDYTGSNCRATYACYNYGYYSGFSWDGLASMTTVQEIFPTWDGYYYLPENHVTHQMCVTNDLSHPGYDGCYYLNDDESRVTLGGTCPRTCVDHPDFLNRLAVFGGYKKDLTTTVSCEELAMSGECTGAQGRLIRALCPQSCGVSDDNKALDYLVQKYLPEQSEMIHTCSDALMYVDCLDSMYGQTLRNLCPCGCNDQLVQYASNDYPRA